MRIEVRVESRRAISSAICTLLPVMPMKVRVCRGTVLVCPIGRTIARFSVKTEARMSELRSLLLKLSRKTAGCASMSAAVKRLSNSSASWPLVKADGLTPLAMMQMAFTTKPLPVLAPLKLGASHRNPGARSSVGHFQISFSGGRYLFHASSKFLRS